MARQLRPHSLWSVPARCQAWVRCWRLDRWWRALSLKKARPDPAGETVQVSPTGPSQVRFNGGKVSMKTKRQEGAQEGKKASSRATQGKWHDMNRKQRREMMRKIPGEALSLEVVHPDAAGIDIGNESHYVAVPPKRDSQSVQRFGCTTAELKAMAAWLKQCGIRTVAMQSTSVYWIAVYDILEQAGKCTW